MQRILAVTLVVAAASGSATAQPAIDPLTGLPDPTQAPGMVTMDRFDSVSRVGGEFRYPFLTSTGGPNRDFAVLDLHAHYVDPASNLGGYAQVPVSFLHTDDFGPGTKSDNSLGFGNLEVGGLYVMKGVARTDVGLVLRFGLMAPTAGRAESFTDGGAANAIGAVSRLNDFVVGIPRGFTARLGASPTVRNGRFFGRADVGVDVNIDRDTPAPRDDFGQDRFDPLIRFNLGGGFDLGRYALMGELVNVISTTTEDDVDRAINVLSLSARFKLGTTQLYTALTFPLDDESREAFDAVLTFGVESVLLK